MSNENSVTTAPKKRGRKTKQELINIISGGGDESVATAIAAPPSSSTSSAAVEASASDTSTQPQRSRRGRKPNSSKIIENINTIQVASNFHNFGSKNATLPSVILHLKCRITDTLQNNDYKFCDITHQNNSLLSFASTSNLANLNYSMLPQYEPLDSEMSNPIIPDVKSHGKDASSNDTNSIPYSSKYQTHELNKKINHLDFIINSQIEIKQSACFWCTESFDNTAIHIPKCQKDGVYEVYGNFCSLECAVAHLISTVKHKSVLAEQYTLLHQLYLDTSPNLKTHIKPAPEPRYMLDKFLGNLSIEEYRSLHALNRHFILLDKPIKKVSPEYHEEYNGNGVVVKQ